MNLRSITPWLLACAVALMTAGCMKAPGKPKPGPEVARPAQVLDFNTLYSQNCAACHGANGKNGAAISLANPVYLAIAGVANIQRVTAAGVSGTMMPPFSKEAGGMLTDQQIMVLAHGMVSAWGNSTALAGQSPPAYANSSAGDPARGQKTFVTYCARCHGVDGNGITINQKMHIGSLVDPAYLSLISDQALRSFIIGGRPAQGMPDWRADGTNALTNPQITDIVAWLTSHRIATPGQPYQQHQ